MQKYDYILVEDNPDDIELILDAINSIDNNLTHLLLRDGEEAHDFFDNLSLNGKPRPKMIILDLKLPKISGFEVLERLKENEKISKIPVIALTSSKSMSDMYKSYDLGVNAYIIKPIDFDEFNKVVGKIGEFWILHNECP